MASITLTNQTNSPIKLDTTYFWVDTPTTADLTGLDLQIAEIYRDAGPWTASAPENTSLPTVSGDATVGAILSGPNGSWTGYPAPVFTYQWLRDDAPIDGADEDEYTLIAEDAGAEITFAVTATNALGSDTAVSEPVGPVTAEPDADAPPVISGTAQVGETLSATDGVWTGYPAPTFEYQWQRSEDGTSEWSAISDATDDTYTLVEDDEGQYIRIRVTATNSAGSDSADSLASEMVLPE